MKEDFMKFVVNFLINGKTLKIASFMYAAIFRVAMWQAPRTKVIIIPLEEYRKILKMEACRIYAPVLTSTSSPPNLVSPNSTPPKAKVGDEFQVQS